MRDEDVGKPQRTIEVEPLHDPFPVPVREPAPAPGPAPVEPEREPVKTSEAT